MISRTRLIYSKNLQRSNLRNNINNKCTTHTRCTNKQHDGDLFNKVTLLNDEDTRELYVKLHASLLDKYPKIDASNIDGLTYAQLNRICLYLDLIQVTYINENKFGYLTQFDILSNKQPFSSVRVVEMTAKERIDVRNRLTTLVEEFPKLESYCYNLMLKLRVLGKDEANF